MKSSSSAPKRRSRRKFTAEFKAEAVRLALQPGQSIAAIAKSLDLTETALRSWIKQAEIDQGQGRGGSLSTAEKQELAALRKEVKQLKMEREILRKATAFFAKEQM